MWEKITDQAQALRIYERHQELMTPQPDTVLWRYTDFTGLVSLLEEEALFFSRADLLGDPFEGSVTRINKLINQKQTQIPPEVMLRYEQTTKKLPKTVLISCWHESNYESDAMWKLYSDTKHGIAIKTTAGNLKNGWLSDEEAITKRVSYIDYNKRDFIPAINMLDPFFYKRNHFKHENEVRMLLPACFRSDALQKIDVGEYHKVDLSKLIQEVVVAPFSPEWFLELVKKVVSRHIPDKKVTRSDTEQLPVWG